MIIKSGAERKIRKSKLKVISLWLILRNLVYAVIGGFYGLVYGGIFLLGAFIPYCLLFYLAVDVILPWLYPHNASMYQVWDKNWYVPLKVSMGLCLLVPSVLFFLYNLYQDIRSSLVINKTIRLLAQNNRDLIFRNNKSQANKGG